MDNIIKTPWALILPLSFLFKSSVYREGSTTTCQGCVHTTGEIQLLIVDFPESWGVGSDSIGNLLIIISPDSY